MGMRERDKWDLLLGQGALLAVLCALFFVGGGLGCFLSGLVSGEGARELGEYLADYLSVAYDGVPAVDFWGTLWNQLRWLLAEAVLGLTAIGVIGIPALFCVRGFLFTFSVGCFCRVFGSLGLLPALALFGMPALLWGPALFLAGFQGLMGAQCLLRRGLGDGRCPLPFTTAYWFRMGLALALFLAGAGAEYFLAPVLLRAAARVIL